jgi:hypothetical protein
MPDGLESIFVQRDSLVLLAKNDDESAQGEGN